MRLIQDLVVGITCIYAATKRFATSRTPNNGAVLLLCALPALGAGDDFRMTALERAVWSVETSQCPGDCPRGDGGKALGPLQIHRGCWTDVAKPGEKYSDCSRLDYSVVVFRRYMNRYATERRLGRIPTNEDMARIWNGGPNGFKKSSTKKYWTKVRSRLGDDT